MIDKDLALSAVLEIHQTMYMLAHILPDSDIALEMRTIIDFNTQIFNALIEDKNLHDSFFKKMILHCKKRRANIKFIIRANAHRKREK